MKKAIVFGNGVSGKGAKKLLESEGVQVVLVDDKTGVSSANALVGKSVITRLNSF